MTKTKKVKKKSCAKVPKKVKATFKEGRTSPTLYSSTWHKPGSGVLTNCSGYPMDQPPHDIISNGNLSELWPHVVKKIETLQRSKMISFICFVVIAFALIAAILVLNNPNTCSQLAQSAQLSVSYLIFPCLIISVFKGATIFFSELTNN